MRPLNWARLAMCSSLVSLRISRRRSILSSMEVSSLPSIRNGCTSQPLEVELKTSCRTALCLTNVQAGACPMDLEVTTQCIPSDSADMPAEVEPNFSRSGDEITITEEVHSF